MADRGGGWGDGSSRDRWETFSLAELRSPSWARTGYADPVSIESMLQDPDPQLVWRTRLDMAIVRL